jgi:hypothetical protein
MDIWETIFTQSPVNDGYYDEETLPHLRWEWPRATWLQARREYLRQHQTTLTGKSSRAVRN